MNNSTSHVEGAQFGVADDVLSNVYIQLSQTDPAAILGVAPDASLEDVRQAFRALALQLHPDKAPSEELRLKHTELFQKLQQAYESMISPDSDEEEEVEKPVKRLPETWEALHARNQDFKERLKAEREKALNFFAWERAEKKKQAEPREEKIRKKKEDRIARQAEAKEAAERRRAEAADRRNIDRPRTKRSDLQASVADFDEDAETRMHETGTLDLEGKVADSWEAAEDQMQRHEKKEGKNKLRNKPTSDNATPMYDRAIDEALVSEADIKRRWYKQLLSGGGYSGSVSLEEKKRIDNNSRARMLQYEKQAIAAADGMLKPALLGNSTFSGMEHDAVLQSVTDAEMAIEARVEEALRLMDQDIVDRYVIGRRWIETDAAEAAP